MQITLAALDGYIFQSSNISSQNISGFTIDSAAQIFVINIRATPARGVGVVN